MARWTAWLSAAGGVLLASALQAFSSDGPRVLILSGQSNHAWEKTTPVLKEILDGEGFEVAVTEHPEQLTPADLEDVDVLVSNWNTFPRGKKAVAVASWPAATQKAFLQFVRRGGGHVAVHAGSSSFYDWPDYQAVGLAWWKLGTTGHGPRHTFKVRTETAEHPITRGLDPFETQDELWHRSGSHPGATPLVSAWSDTAHKGSGAWEPVAFAGQVDQGRCFTLLLGHDTKAMENPGFRTLLVRGVQWAAHRLEQ